MKINNIKVKFGRTIKTAEYENARFDVEYSVTVPPEKAEGVMASAITRSLQEAAEKAVQADINRYFLKRRNK